MDQLANISPSAILAAIIFSILGGLVIKQGRNRKSVELYFIGFSLIGYGYFVYDPILVWVIGIGLTALALKYLQG